MADYNLIVKADTLKSAIEHIDEHLSVPIKAARTLGYGEVIATVEGNPDVLTDQLTKWLRDSRPPEDKGAYNMGALIWWQA